MKKQHLVPVKKLDFNVEQEIHIGPLMTGQILGRSMPREIHFLGRSEGIGLSLCTQGCAQFKVGTNTLAHAQGCLLLLAPIHTLRTLTVTEDYEARIIAFPSNYLDGFNSKLPASPRSIPDFFNSPTVDLPSADFALAMQIVNIISQTPHAEMSTPYRDLFIQHQVYPLLELYLARHSTRISTQEPNNELQGLTARFMELVMRHYREHRFVLYYAEQLGVTTKYLSTLVQKKTGVDASKWIAHFVILEARSLLSISDMSVKQIASELHFVDISTFGKYFKRYCGCTPLEYRLDPNRCSLS